MDSFIPYGKQCIDEADIKAVVDVLTSDYLTQGPKVAEFEKAICEYTGAKYCVAVSNGTAALHIAVAALEIEAGKEGITSPNTFVASANCMVYNRLTPLFADIDALTYNIDIDHIMRNTTDNTRLLVPVHFAGRPVNMTEIANWAQKKNLYVIEDAAHAIGSNYPDGSKVGNCQYSDMTVFSFHPVKTITTAEGGVITTNSESLYKKLLLLRSHGITKEENELTEKQGEWYYEMQSLGYNYRLSDLHAALGISQLLKLDMWKKRRKEIFVKYNEAFSHVDWLQVPFLDKHDNSCFHLYVLLIDFYKIKKTRSQVMKILREKRIGTQVHYIPVHIQPFYRSRYGYAAGDYPVAEKYYEKALSIPLYPMMNDHDIDYIIEQILDVGHNYE